MTNEEACLSVWENQDAIMIVEDINFGHYEYSYIALSQI